MNKNPKIEQYIHNHNNKQDLDKITIKNGVVCTDDDNPIYLYVRNNKLYLRTLNETYTVDITKV